MTRPRPAQIAAAAGRTLPDVLAPNLDDLFWTYNLQGPEPNPEVLEYVWPRFGWPGYVRGWHLTFC